MREPSVGFLNVVFSNLTALSSPGVDVGESMRDLAKMGLTVRPVLY